MDRRRLSPKAHGRLSESARMLKIQVRRWSERPRMLVFMLGVMLPAAALIAVGVWHLRTIQREKSVEAVFQREYQQVLAIAEKRDRKSTRLNSSHRCISYAVFCLKKKK